MSNKRITPEQFAQFIFNKTGKNLTCPICGSDEHYLHDGYDTFTEVCGQRIIGVPTITYKLMPSITELSQHADERYIQLHLNNSGSYQNMLNEKSRMFIIVTCTCCSNILLFDRERILDEVRRNESSAQ